MCGAKFLNDTAIEIYTERRRGHSYVVKTNGTGQFQAIAGVLFLIGDLEQQLIIHHYCDVDVDEFGNEPYKRKSYLELPHRFATPARENGSLYDIGRLNMQTIFPAEEKVELMQEKDNKPHYPFSNTIPVEEKVKLGSEKSEKTSKKSGCEIL
ncbi:hypothetical protein ACH3XW_10320 [Acanthocheilonema viteae]